MKAWIVQSASIALLVSSGVWAQPSRDPDLARPEVAKGAEHYDRGEYHEAYLQFRRSA